MRAFHEGQRMVHVHSIAYDRVRVADGISAVSRVR